MSRIIFFFILLICTSSVSAKSYPIRWKVKETKIDANISDWNRSVSYYDAASKLRYGIRNDSDNLYIAFLMTNPMMQTKISSAGIVCKLKYKNEEKLKPVIHIKPFLNRGMKKGGQRNKPSLDEKRATYKMNKPPVSLEGFASCNGNIYSMQHDKAITYAFDWDSTGTMIMEMKIPLKQLFGESFTLDQLVKQKMTLNFTLKALERPESNQGGVSVSGRQGGRQGSGHPGGGGGGMRPAGTQSRGSTMKMFESQFFSKKFMFALKPE